MQNLHVMQFKVNGKKERKATPNKDIPFPRVLVLCEMQSVSSRIWTRIAVFISYGDNDYTTGTSNSR